MSKCVAITIETRPDYCLKPHLNNMLRYGCTRIEIGVQSVYEVGRFFLRRRRTSHVTRIAATPSPQCVTPSSNRKLESVCSLDEGLRIQSGDAHDA